MSSKDEVTPVGYENGSNGSGDPILTLEEASHQIAVLHRRSRKRDQEGATIEGKIDALLLSVDYLRENSTHNRKAIGRVTNAVLAAAAAGLGAIFLGTVIGSALAGVAVHFVHGLLGH